jgi:monofunctional biosynthetic peptidoglycan transglycosylase
MTIKAKPRRQTLRAEDRASQLSGSARRRKPKRKAGRDRKKRRASSGWRRLVTWTLLVVLAGPALVMLVYRVVPPPVTPLMLIRALEGEEIDYRWTPLEEISPHLAHAAIASEDNRFCEHWGFDFEEFLVIFEDWRDGERPRGASTITMQTAKNILLWPKRQVARKLLEAWLTPQLELLWSKRRILEVYLNVAEMGPGIYGAEAAAQRHFGKLAATLTVREAALLAAALPSPRRAAPGQPTDYLNDRVPIIRQRIDQLGPMLACAS